MILIFFNNTVFVSFVYFMILSKCSTLSGIRIIRAYLK